MNWGSSWDDNKPKMVDVDTRPFGQVLKEHNETAEAMMKAAAITKTGQEILAQALPYFVGIDNGKDDKWSVCIMQGNQILAMGEDVDLEIPSGWNTYKAKAIQIGDFAVVISTNDPEDRCIIHVPTQTWFDNATPDYQGDGEGYSIEQLCLWVWKIQQTERIYFKELAKYNNSNYKSIDKAMLSNMQQYCLSIKVE